MRETFPAAADCKSAIQQIKNLRYSPMKTPRDILLAQHRAAGPQLDAIRRAVVTDELNHQATKEQSGGQPLVAWFLRCSNLVWRELILPSRRTWSGLAAVWLLIVAVNVAERDHSSAGKFSSASSAPTMMSFREQQQLMNELFADRSVAADAEPPKTFSPKPRTETTKMVAV